MMFDRHQVRRIEQTLNFIAIAASTYLILRIVVGPDTLRRGQMYVYLNMSRAANKGSARLADLAAHSATRYQRCRNVTA